MRLEIGANMIWHLVVQNCCYGTHRCHHDAFTCNRTFPISEPWVRRGLRFGAPFSASLIHERTLLVAGERVLRALDIFWHGVYPHPSDHTWQAASTPSSNLNNPHAHMLAPNLRGVCTHSPGFSVHTIVVRLRSASSRLPTNRPSTPM